MDKLHYFISASVLLENGFTFSFNGCIDYSHKPQLEELLKDCSAFICASVKPKVVTIYDFSVDLKHSYVDGKSF